MHRNLIIAAVVLVPVGCGQTPVAQNPTAANSPAANSPVANSLVTAQPGDGSARNASPQVGQGAVASQTATTPPATTSPATTGESAPSLQPKKPKTALDFANDARQAEAAGDLAAAEAALHEAVTLEPGNRRFAGSLASVQHERAVNLIQGGDPKQGYPKFMDRAATMRKLRGSVDKLTVEEQSLLANAIYNEACAFSVDGDAVKALVSLREALAAGFNDLKLLSEDPDLAEVRKLPEYQPLVAAHLAKQAKAAEETKQPREENKQ